MTAAVTGSADDDDENNISIPPRVCKNMQEKVAININMKCNILWCINNTTASGIAVQAAFISPMSVGNVGNVQNHSFFLNHNTLQACRLAIFGYCVRHTHMHAQSHTHSSNFTQHSSCL